MTGEVVLSAALRSNLLSLTRTQSSIDRVQNVLATGLKVSSALDNPQSFFASQALKNRSSDLTKLLDGIGQSIQTIKAADAGVTGLTKLVEQASSIVDSAREAVTNGTKEAAVTGNIDLSGITDLAGLSGVTATDELIFSVRASDGTAITLSNPGGGAGTIAIAANDSIEQLVTKINDLTDATGATSATNGKQLIEASVDSNGNLKLRGLEGVDLNVTFNASVGTAGGAQDQALASALGFGQYAKVTRAGTDTSAVEFTATASTKLTSGTFFDATSGFADASDALSTIRTLADGAGAVRFQNGSAGDAAQIDITINDETLVSLTFDETTTIQGLVDSINNNSTLKQFVAADYDATTGSFTIEATAAETQTIKIELEDGVTGGAGGNTIADFDFGVDAQFNDGGNSATDAEGENFVLATAASVLSQFEDDYNVLRGQIDELVEDSGYRGVNLINGEDLNTFFNEDRTNKLTTNGDTLTASGLGLNAADFSRIETIEASDTDARDALTTLRSFGGTLSNSLSIIQTRETFTKSLVETLNEGSDKLIVADQNEEGAKLLALQTRQQLGVTSLSLAAQAQQSVLRLF